MGSLIRVFLNAYKDVRCDNCGKVCCMTLCLRASHSNSQWRLSNILLMIALNFMEAVSKLSVNFLNGNITCVVLNSDLCS